MRLVLCCLVLVVAATTIAEKRHENDWEVYFGKDFSKNELCATLRCGRHEACLVKHRNAMCLRLDKLDQIDGIKLHHETREHVTSQSLRDHAEWDPDRVQAKMDEYKEKMTRKHKLFRRNQRNEIHQSEHRHMERHSTPVVDCSIAELKGMGGRLLQWFTDVHRKATDGVRETSVIPEHHVACRSDVAWMFTQWDGNDDGELTLEELNSLEGDKYEKCIKPFLDRCDDNGDDVLSMDEWCDCFSWVGNERKEPPCHAAAHMVDPHMLGSFRPRCDVDGFYRPLQCHERQCWCADRWGREFPSSRVHGAKADCGQYADPTDDMDDEDFLNPEGSGKTRDL